ncbi:putative LPS assembly protein LptD [Ferruginibacter yonginensis]|uniref:LPS assembly protein LptD n=1 Tax=Ferruginibacter yonginensis TaxID=1310416 RepID=A0ABV8QQY1_9BACT
MNNSNKGKAKNILAWGSIVLLVLLTYHLQAFTGFNSNTYFFTHAIVDSPPIKINKADTTILQKDDTLRTPRLSEEKKPVVDSSKIPFADTFNIRLSKDSLLAPVVYHADDSMVIDVPNEKMYLYGKVSSVKYDENDLSAPVIEFDQKTSTVGAYLKKDSTGKVLAYPYFKQSDFESVSDTIRFNMKTGKGLTKGTYTKQGEMFVYGEKIKKADTSVFYALNGRFTTCNLDTPHFAFIAKKIKFVNKKWAYTGPVHPEFEGVPLPITLPFGIFPLTQGRHSGLLAPSFIADEQRGLALQNLGYYKIITQNLDVITRGSLYSYGSYNVTVNPRYFKRYRYQGNVNVSYQNFQPLDAGKTKSINFQWVHNADNKARPGVTFMANVNAGSTKYNSQVPNNAQLNFNNQLASTISYSKVWKNKPYNISINANHNQNSTTGITNIFFPDASFNVNTLYPFRRKEPIGDYKWYENIGIAYNGNTKAQSNFYDTAGRIINQINDNLKYGAIHRVPITLALPSLGVLQLAPSVSYEETWYQSKVTKQYNPASKKIDTVDIKKGLYTARQMTFGLTASTRVFGLFGFGEKSSIKAIRHEIRPSITANYIPNFNNKNYYKSVIDSAGNSRNASYFEDNNYAAYNNVAFGGINFSIDNNITAKFRNKKDTSAKADKKVSLLDGLSISGSYNFLIDSFQFSFISVSARTNLYDKINVTATASFDPYQIDKTTGRRINKTVWAKKPLTLGNLTSATVALQTSFKGGDQSKKTPTETLNSNRNSTTLNNDEYDRDAAYIQANPGEFADFTIPWSIDLSYSLTVSKSFDITKAGYTSILAQGITFNASTNLTSKWKLGAQGTFDVTSQKLGYLSGYLSRDLHCWQMNISVSPVGRSRYFSISISPKSTILRDLKVNRTRSFTDF